MKDWRFILAAICLLLFAVVLCTVITMVYIWILHQIVNLF